MSNNGTGLGNSEKLHSALEDLLKGWNALRKVFGEQGDKLKRNMEAAKVFATFLNPQENSRERRQEILDGMSRDEVVRVAEAAQEMAEEVVAYGLWRAGEKV